MSARHVLVVDDDRVIVDLLRYTLERAGLSVVFAFNGQEALDMFDREKPALAIVDIAMPDMDGYEFISRIRGKPGAEGRIPLIILSAHEQDVMRNYAEELGVNLYLVKPTPPDTLVSHVRRLLASSAA